ncbi:hypothetical protein F5Y08DRAFT_293225 [Xylaria arbuscula]|nr:hypothetical protein F5Y08DRAFT_293225 [Xylaria arbuscula]
MSSFFSAALRLLTQRKQGEGHMSNEHQQNVVGRLHGGEPSMIPPANGPVPDAGAIASRVDNRPLYLNPDEDPLTLFRLMLGIQSTPYLGFTLSSPIGTRPAANIGLYARIVHSEQKAKDSFKVFSIVINGCYFLQIVIAAALTALGAAGASSGAVTAFGALNTVIAGFLTFLKGSGLPGRLKYYGNEWKKIREFIEQRERDFMRPGHNLSVYEAIDTIEKMYNNLKADIELNTPDSYTSVTNQRRVGNEKETKIGGIDMSQLETIATKLKGFDSGKLDSLTASITRKTEDVTKNIHEHEKQIGDQVDNLKRDVIRDVQSHKAHLDHEAREREAQALATINQGKQTVRDAKDTVEGQVARLDNEARSREAHARAAVAEGKQTARAGVESLDGEARRREAQARTAITEGKQATVSGVQGQVARLEDTVDDQHRRLDSAASEQHARALATINNTGRAAQEGIDTTRSHATGSVSGLVREISDIHRTAMSGGRRAAAQQIRSLAQRLGVHDDSDESSDSDNEGDQRRTRTRNTERRPGS